MILRWLYTNSGHTRRSEPIQEKWDEMRFVMRLKFSLILVALAAIALASQSLAEPPDSPAPTQFAGLPVTITAPRDGSRSVFLRLRMEEGQCKVSARLQMASMSIFLLWARELGVAN